MNKNTKHTPGPWYAVQPAGANGWWVVSKDKEGVECVDESHDGGFKESTARLIAAAPDHHAVALELDRLMLVIESAVRQHDPSHSEAVVAMLKANRATIAKATGEHHD